MQLRSKFRYQVLARELILMSKSVEMIAVKFLESESSSFKKTSLSLVKKHGQKVGNPGEGIRALGHWCFLSGFPLRSRSFETMQGGAFEFPMPLHDFWRKFCLVVLMFAACLDKVDCFMGLSTPSWQSQRRRVGCALSSSTMRVGMANSREGDRPRDPHLVLGLKPGTYYDRRAIKSRFRSLVLLLHPDTCSEEQREEKK
jgi:hypothetical protein